MSKVFAWVRGLRGPEPQIISDEIKLDPKQVAARVIAQVEIDDSMSLDDCIAAYPAPDVRFY
jgi:hypothetical protein